MKLLAYALIAVGLVLGPAYWIHAKFYTGSDAALITLKPATPAGLAKVWQSEPFELTEAMAPAGLILVAQGRFSPNMDEGRPPRDSYSAVLSHDGTSAEPLIFSLGVKYVSDSNPAFREHLLYLQKVKPGRYTIRITQAAEPAIQIDRMQLQVRQHLQEPNPNLFMSGVGLMLLGIFGLVLL